MTQTLTCYCHLLIWTLPPATAIEPAAATPPAAVQMDAKQISPLNGAAVDELSRIRHQLGGGVLQGSLLQNAAIPEQAAADDLEFRQQLRETVDPRRPRSPSAADRHSPPNVAPSNTSAAAEYRRRNLRSLGRRLTALAEDMDEWELYEEAHRLRQVRERLEQLR